MIPLYLNYDFQGSIAVRSWWNLPSHTGWGPPVISLFVYKPWNNPHQLVRYIYHKPLNSATYKPTERCLGGPILSVIPCWKSSQFAFPGSLCCPDSPETKKNVIFVVNSHSSLMGKWWENPERNLINILIFWSFTSDIPWSDMFRKSLLIDESERIHNINQNNQMILFRSSGLIKLPMYLIYLMITNNQNVSDDLENSWD